jgi:transcriptional regulator with XRE-family HTH domain
MEFDRKGFYRELGLRLQLHRKRKGLTQEELAAAVGVPRASYANVEGGRQSAAIDLIWRVAVVLDISLDDIAPQPVRGEAQGSGAENPPLHVSTATQRVSIPL